MLQGRFLPKGFLQRAFFPDCPYPAPSLAHHSITSYYKSRVLRNPFHLFLSVACRTLGLQQQFLLIPFSNVSQKTNKNPILPHTSSTLHVHPWGGSFPTAMSEQLSPAIRSGEADTNSAPQCPGGGCSHDKNEHIYTTLTGGETEVQNSAPCHAVMNKIQGLLSFFRE